MTKAKVKREKKDRDREGNERFWLSFVDFGLLCCYLIFIYFI